VRPAFSAFVIVAKKLEIRNAVIAAAIAGTTPTREANPQKRILFRIDTSSCCSMLSAGSSKSLVVTVFSFVMRRGRASLIKKASQVYSELRIELLVFPPNRKQLSCLFLIKLHANERRGVDQDGIEVPTHIMRGGQ